MSDAMQGTMAINGSATPRPPQVAVVMTTFNRVALVAEAMGSVLAQTLRDFELVVVDDGSTDGTRQLLRSYADHDPRIRVVEQPNAGAAAAANVGVAHSTAPLIARLDSDDVAQPDRLERQVRFMRGHPRVVCAGSFVDLIDDRGRFLTVEEKPLHDGAIQEDLLRGHCAISHSSCVVRRDAFERVGGYDESFRSALDLDFFLRIGEAGRLANQAGSLTRYRLHRDSISGRKQREQYENVRRACVAAWARRGESRPFAHRPWRPSDEAASRLQFSLQYGWWANRSGEFQTAASYGWDAVRLGPMNRQAWALLGWSLLRRQAAPPTTAAQADQARPDNAAATAGSPTGETVAA